MRIHFTATPPSQMKLILRRDPFGAYLQQSWADANVFASPTRKHFDNAKREDVPPLKTKQL